MVDSLQQLPRHFSDQFGSTLGTVVADVSCHGLQNKHEEEEEETEAKGQRRDYSLFDASCIDSDVLDGTSFLEDVPEIRAPNVGADRGQHLTQFSEKIGGGGAARQVPQSAQAAKFVREDNVPDDEMLEF